jgi:hypothetical protein
MSKRKIFLPESHFLLDKAGKKPYLYIRKGQANKKGGDFMAVV